MPYQPVGHGEVRVTIQPRAVTGSRRPSGALPCRSADGRRAAGSLRGRAPFEDPAGRGVEPPQRRTPVGERPAVEHGDGRAISQPEAADVDGAAERVLRLALPGAVAVAAGIGIDDRDRLEGRAPRTANRGGRPLEPSSRAPAPWCRRRPPAAPGTQRLPARRLWNADTAAASPAIGGRRVPISPGRRRSQPSAQAAAAATSSAKAACDERSEKRAEVRTEHTEPNGRPRARSGSPALGWNPRRRPPFTACSQGRIPMPVCETAGSNYDKAFQVVMGRDRRLRQLRVRDPEAGADLRSLRDAHHRPRAGAGQQLLLLRPLPGCKAPRRCATGP